MQAPRSFEHVLAYLERLCYTTVAAIEHGLRRDERGKSMYRKEIVYDRETRDYAMYLDGELVGFARTYHEAEITLDQLVFELMNMQYFREAA
jgi:hypothetical protein